MRNIYIFLASFAFLLILGAGCVNQQVSNSNNYKSAAPPEVTGNSEFDGKIGVLLPFSGDAASYGESVRKAVELAKKDFKLDKAKLVFGDSKCEGKEAAAEIQKMISIDQVVAVIGELCSGATLAAAPIAEREKVVLISPASTAPAVSEAGEYVFRTVPSDLLQGAFGANLVYNKGLRKLAVLYVNDDYGVGFNDVLQDVFPKLGGRITASEAVERGSVDVRGQLTKIKNTEPDSLYIISNSPDTASAALKQIKQLNLDVAVFGSEGLKNDDILAAAGESAEGMTLTTVSAGSQNFLESYKSEYNVDQPGPFAAQGYDAMAAIAKAIQGGARTGEDIKNALFNIKFEGAAGSVEFDGNGDVKGKYDVYIVKDGKFIIE